MEQVGRNARRVPGRQPHHLIGKDSYLEGPHRAHADSRGTRAVYAGTRRGEQAVTISADLAKTWPEFALNERAVLLQRVEDRVRIVWR